MMTAVLKESKRKARHRIAIAMRETLEDPQAEHLHQQIHHYLHLPVEEVKIVSLYTIEKELDTEAVSTISSSVLSDSVLQQTIDESSLSLLYSWMVEVSFKEGMTDNAGNTAQITIEDYLGITFDDGERVHSGTLFCFKGDLNHEQVHHIAYDLLANPLIQNVSIRCCTQQSIEGVSVIDLNIDDDALIKLSQQCQLALNLEEMKAIRDYYNDPKTQEARQRQGMPTDPTDVELEALAQTWSEHCKHKIFQAKIRYNDQEIDSLFKTYIKGATDVISEKIDWLVSVFSDNAGIFHFNDHYNVAFKVETHNSPSALDPYGGALTGILGVMRDIMGAGMGARLLASTDVFCFAPPCYEGKIPERLMHPKRIFEGVRRGVEHGGNKSGVPTVNGAILFDDRYLGKPLVYCGTVGIMPKNVDDTPTHEKPIHPGDLIVVAGGRTGRDGIHGATFSSEELHAESPSSAVQIGDPFTQKKVHDFLMEARDANLFNTLTDNGAGGFSSSVGELAEISGGCLLHLDQVKLKCPDLKPWEILVSESQERMTLAVPEEKFSALKALAAKHEVEILAIGTFTDSGHFHITHNGNTVALLPLSFLHNGVPQMQLEAQLANPSFTPIDIPAENLGDRLKSVLSCYNVCSKESVIRQYDHEVQGGSALKPLVGVDNDGPGDAAVIRPSEALEDPLTPNKGVVVGNGICPKFSDLDAYAMAASAIDEAVRNCIAVGANPATISILDNFCWPDPVTDKHKLAQLVEANRALYDVAVGYGIPIISGKDSMKNDYKMGGVKISVPPTLLISAIALIDDVTKTVSMDVKVVGDIVYLIGETKDELGASEYATDIGQKGGKAPALNINQTWNSYLTLHKAIEQRLIASCHDCSDGGLAVALAEKAFAGGYGIEVSLVTGLAPTEELFSESNGRFVVTVGPDNVDTFEALMKEIPHHKLGTVTEDPVLHITSCDGTSVIQEPIASLKEAWQQPLKEF